MLDARGQACERIRKHLEHGAPWDACDVFRDAIAAHGGDAELLYWGALAHARAGAARRAHELLDQASAIGSAPERLADVSSLRGRLWKDACERAHDETAAREFAERARSEYLAAFELRQDVYPGINAATLSLLLGDRTAAQHLARRILDRLGASTAPPSCWDHATLGEAKLLVDQPNAAKDAYAAAYREARGDAGNVASMRRQLELLARVMPEAAEALPMLRPADVVAFAGHMIDASDRPVPRFPTELVPAVESAVRERLSRLNAPVVFASAACGADLIFIEAALAAGAEVNVVLPFDRADFVRISVASGGDGWVDRFDAVLSRATRVIMATDENYLGDDVLFEHGSMLLEGLTVLRAAQLRTQPMLLCVLDSRSSGDLGGTHESVERWQRRIGPAEKIDLAELRAPTGLVRQSGSAGKPQVAGPPEPRPRAALLAADSTGAERPQRTLKTMLFADFAGSSRLHDSTLPQFQQAFWKIAAGQLEASRAEPLLASTWGDALYVVFESAADGAEFALRFLDGMRETDWLALGLSDATPIRIALHAGPVFRGFDPIMRRDNFFGSGVTKAARIEPVTPPGTVYASEAFAATLAATGSDEFVLEYVGRLPLAKSYGESRIYRLDRR